MFWWPMENCVPINNNIKESWLRCFIPKKIFMNIDEPVFLHQVEFNLSGDDTFIMFKATTQ